MFRTTAIIAALLVLLASAGGCARRGAEPVPVEPPPAEQPAPAPEQPASEQPTASPEMVREWLRYLTLEEKVGQMLWVGLEGEEPDARITSMLAAGKAGGIILFGRNGTDPESNRRLIAQLQHTVAGRERASPALVVMADQEGGLVQRYSHPFTEWPGNMALGATGDPNLAYRMAAAVAAELRAVGINMNLAPVADVNNNPANPVIGIRSFGEDVTLVSRMVAAAVRGYQDNGVLATVKHFPGHGDTGVDSHHALPVIEHSLERLERVELPPFRAALDAGAAAVMTGHLVFPSLVPDGKPATLAHEVITGLLRERLGHRGVVVTDAMEMAAIAANPGVGEGLIQAVLAGADALLLAESFAEQERYHALLVGAVRNGRIPPARIDEAVSRLLTMKAAAGLLPGLSGRRGASGGEAPATSGAPDAGRAPATGGAPGAGRATATGGAPVTGGAPSLSAVGAAEHRALAQEIAEKAVTLVRNDAGLLPLRLAPEEQVLVVSPNAEAARAAEGATWLGASIREHHPNTDEVTVGRLDLTEHEAEAVRSRLAAADLVVYGVYNAGSAHRALIREILATGKPLVLIGLGEPYDLLKLPEAETYVAAYGYAGVNLRAVAPPLFGGRPFTGKLPVSIPGL